MHKRQLVYALTDFVVFGARLPAMGMQTKHVHSEHRQLITRKVMRAQHSARTCSARVGGRRRERIWRGGGKAPAQLFGHAEDGEGRRCAGTEKLQGECRRTSTIFLYTQNLRNQVVFAFLLAI